MDDATYRERLARDLRSWRHAGLLDEAQEGAILARVGASDAAVVRALRMGWIVSIVSIIGALVLGGGVVLLFASNWEDLPDWFRVASIAAGITAAYAVGYYLTWNAGLHRVGGAFFLLGVVLYQAGVFLLAQIYNMPVDDPLLFLLAAAGTLPLAYAFGSRIVLLLGLAALVAWLMAESSQRVESGAQEWATPLVLGLSGLLLYGAGQLHRLRSSLAAFGDVYALAGAGLTLVVVYFATFGSIWDEVINSGVESYAAPSLVYVLIAAAAVLIVAQVAWRARDGAFYWDIAFQSALLAVATVVATWPAWTGYALVFNVVFFAVAVGLVARGYTEGDERFVNAGLVVIAAGLVTRYIDTFWSLLAGSAFFIAGGVLLLALAFVLERFRRELLRNMQAVPAAGASA